MKFTQEVKNKWLEALKSGKYTQIARRYKHEDNGHCCLAVLGELFCNGSYPHFLDGEIRENLIRVNDDTFNPNKPDYSNVIPAIEQLTVNN